MQSELECGTSMRMCGKGEYTMQPLVSVIVPVYKVEAYLERCVNSILNQTYRNFELILVDDGSPDHCPELCDECAKKDSRIKVIHKPNGGVSDARNVGMDEAKGDYITFVDSDDWVLPQYIEELVRLIRENNSQVSVCCCALVTQEINHEQKVVLKEKVFDKVQALETMLYQRHFDTSAWGKMYLGKVIQKYRFPVGKRMEELGIIYRVLMDCESVAWTKQKLYCYYQNESSLTHQGFRVDLLDGIELIDEQFNNIITIYPELKKPANSKKFSVYCYSLRVLAEQDEKWNQIRTKLWSFIKSYRIIMLLDSKARIKNRIAAMCSFLGKNGFSKLRI